MVQFLSIIFFFLAFFNFCWVFQKFPFFCVILYKFVFSTVKPSAIRITFQSSEGATKSIFRTEQQRCTKHGLYRHGN